jgi:hypothetical protein
MLLKAKGIEIELVFDEEGFPEIKIETNGYLGVNNRPTVEVTLNNYPIHEMFDYGDADDEPDVRWDLG